jgi:hypothetical protein
MKGSDGNESVYAPLIEDATLFYEIENSAMRSFIGAIRVDVGIDSITRPRTINLR